MPKSSELAYTIPEGIQTIAGDAFNGCTNLISITLPESLTNIGDSAFNGCTGLTSIKSKITEPFDVNGCFDSQNYEKATLRIPYGTRAKYESTSGWSSFRNIVEEQQVTWDLDNRFTTLIMEFSNLKNTLRTHVDSIITMSCELTVGIDEIGLEEFYGYRESIKSIAQGVSDSLNAFINKNTEYIQILSQRVEALRNGHQDFTEEQLAAEIERFREQLGKDEKILYIAVAIDALNTSKLIIIEILRNMHDHNYAYEAITKDVILASWVGVMEEYGYEVDLSKYIGPAYFQEILNASNYEGNWYYSYSNHEDKWDYLRNLVNNDMLWSKWVEYGKGIQSQQYEFRSMLNTFIVRHREFADELAAEGLEETITLKLNSAISKASGLPEFPTFDANTLFGVLHDAFAALVEAQICVLDLRLVRDIYADFGLYDKAFETKPFRLDNMVFEKGHIAELNLKGRGITTDQFPIRFLYLPKLRNLNLSNNYMAGDVSKVTEFIAQMEQSFPLQTLNISGNRFTGNIGLLANSLPNLTELDASKNCLDEVFPMIPTTVTALDLSQQDIARVVPIHVSHLSVEDIVTQMPTILLYDHEKQVYTPDIDLHCQTLDDSWDFTLAFHDGILSIPSMTTQKAYYGENGDTLKVNVLSEAQEGSTFHISLNFSDGDGNFDGQVDVLDLQTDILYIMEQYEMRPFNFTAANLWKDQQVNVQDVICLVNQLMSSMPDDSTQAATARKEKAGDVQTADAEVYICDGQLMVSTSRPVAAWDITVRGTQSCRVAESLQRLGMTVEARPQADGVHIIGYSMSGACLPVGTSVIGTLGNGNVCTVRRVMLSDREARSIDTSLGDTATGVKTTDNSQQASDQDVYDLTGRKADNTARRGIYIQGKRKKVIK